MITIKEELEAAEAAKTAIDRLSPNIGPTIRKAKDIATDAVKAVPSERSLDKARYAVIGSLSNLLHGPPSVGKIEEAKASIKDWMKLLEASRA